LQEKALMKKTVLTLLGLLLIFTANAQTPKFVVRDSLLKKIVSASPQDTVATPIIEQPEFYNQNLIYKLRLDSITKTVPLSYNEFVQAFIDRYSKRKEMMGKMLGLSDYYFPIFEKALAAYHIPVEIKYLPIIESEMNPHAISRVGATGMWQFMFGTAKAYGLVMDNFVDERKDPIQASYAAAAYFRDAYEELGDWLLAIAAYNCGKGNVTRAIDKAGSRDFWAIRYYLPKETRDYVPAFIAAVYVMNYAERHQIAMQAAPLVFKTDTVQVNHFVALADVAQAINYTETALFALNPAYKKQIVNGTSQFPKRIILPKVAQSDYIKLYDLLNTDAEIDKQVILASTDDVRDLKKKIVNKSTESKILVHKVKPGENLTAIANSYRVEIQDLKVWNKLKSNTVIPGQFLKINAAANFLKPVIKPNFISYKVKPGDTLSGIAEKFDGATVSGIKKANGLKKALLQPGMVLKIKS
jgi:membrane-bound lytic murein transglycosylase D